MSNEIFTILDRGTHKKAKYCTNCKRIFTIRKKWENCFEDVKFCSHKCKLEFKRNKLD